MAKKNIDYWEGLLKNLPELYKKSLEREEDYLINNIKKDSNVLEIGCGGGRNLKQLLPITKNLVGIDHDKTAVDLAKKKFKDISEVKILLENAKKLRFKDNSFDYVICMITFANFGQDKFKILKEMKRVVKKDGFILISVFSENAFEERMKAYKYYKAPIKEIKGTTIIFKDSLGDGDNISEQFSKEELKKIFEDVDLKIIEIKNIGILNVCKLKK